MNRLLVALCGISISCGAMFHGGHHATDARAVIAPGALTIKDGRLYFNAWVSGADGSAVAILTGETLVAQKVTFHRDCEGVAAASQDRSPDFAAACSFDVSGASPGRYSLAIRANDRELATVTFAMSPVPVAVGRTALAVETGARDKTAYHRSESVVYYHRIDVTDPVTMLQFVWLRGTEIVKVGEDMAEGPRMEYVGPAIDVVGVVGPGAPREQGDPTPLTLLVFKDGGDLLATLELPGGDLFHVPLRPHARPPADVVSDARRRAKEATKKTFRPQFNDTTFPEEIACAVYTDPEAVKAFAELKGAQTAGHWAWYDAAEAHDDALDDRVTDRERRRLQQRSLDKARQVRAEQNYADANQRTLLKISRRFTKGCLAKLGVH